MHRRSALSLSALTVPAIVMVVAVTAGAAGGPRVPGVRSPRGHVAVIPCLDARGARTLLKRHPTACAVFGPGGSFAQGVNLAGLRWRHWGGRRPTATGYSLGFHQPFAHQRVSVRVYARSKLSCGVLYQLLSVRAGHGRARVITLPGCPGARP